MALQKPTQFTRAYEDFAATAFEARDYDYAAGKMLLLLKEQPGLWRNARLHEYLGRSFLELGDVKNAATAFKNVLVQEPDNQQARQLLHCSQTQLQDILP